MSTIAAKACLEKLRGVSATDFDHRYITKQIAAHTEADILF